MKKITTKNTILPENPTTGELEATGQAVLAFLQWDEKRLDNQRRTDARHLAGIQLIEGVSEALFRWNERTHQLLDDSVVVQIERERLYALLRALSPRDRQMLFLRFFCGWKLRQIALLYEISPSAVSQRLKKILRYLQKNFSPDT